jgi:hypothetical protein
MDWGYGVTAVPERRGTLLPRTLASLRTAGFDRPRLFIDGAQDEGSWRREFGLEVTCHWPRIRTAPSWVLAAWEVYLRNPGADRYAIFQDDIVTCRNLREYLSQCKLPAEKCYLNLYTYDAAMQQLPPDGVSFRGWYLSNQLGKGALGLVFDRKAMQAVLTARHIVQRQGDRSIGRFKAEPDGRMPENWEKAIDGGIVDGLGEQGFTEWIHWPSLLQHTGGEASVAGNQRKGHSPSFPGEGANALDFLRGRG